MSAFRHANPNNLLEEVSRSFYFTMRVLEADVRPQISIAYLLARATDTIADTELVPVEGRLEALQAFRERILGLNRFPLDFGELARHQGASGERELLECCDEILGWLEDLDAPDLKLVREVLEIITSGQELDLRRFNGASAQQISALANDLELDDYTYRVAGCVGEFWTKICRAHLFPWAKVDDKFLLESGVRFGKGLQLVNILRDIPADLRQGRCYIPADALAAAGLKPADLLEPGNVAKFRTLYDGYIAKAAAHLKAGWEYTNALPWRCVRVRLACAWPILIGGKTLARLRTGNVLDPQQRIKVSRAEVKGVLLRSILWYPFPGVWRGQFKGI